MTLVVNHFVKTSLSAPGALEHPSSNQYVKHSVYFGGRVGKFSRPGKLELRLPRLFRGAPASGESCWFAGVQGGLFDMMSGYVLRRMTYAPVPVRTLWALSVSGTDRALSRDVVRYLDETRRFGVHLAVRGAVAAVKVA